MASQSDRHQQQQREEEQQQQQQPRDDSRQPSDITNHRPPPGPQQEDQRNQQPEPKKNHSDQPSDVNHTPTPEPHPPAMGYPPPMGYPPGQPGYPPPPYHHGYPYAQAPPGAYYNPQQMYPLSHQQGYQTSGFARGFLIGIIFLIVFLSATSIIMWLVLRPKLPDFHVDSFAVSHFNASTSVLTATFDSNVTVRNPNTKLKVFFEEIESFLHYNEEEALASGSAPAFSLETKTANVVHVRAEVNNRDQKVTSWVVEGMEKDRANKGMVKFSLRMALVTTFKSGTWWTRHATLKVYCKDLMVSFMNSSGNGSVAKGMDCLVLSRF